MAIDGIYGDVGVSWCYLGEDEILPVGCGDHENLELPVFVDAVRDASCDEALLVVVPLPQPALPRDEFLLRHCRAEQAS